MKYKIELCQCVRVISWSFFHLPLADVSGVDWMVRHGRSLALAIAVKSAPEKLCGKDYCDTVTETILANATADRVRKKFVWHYISHIPPELIHTAVMNILLSLMCVHKYCDSALLPDSYRH